jgi:succinoglycan biosynthesis protein ExoA
VPAVLTSERKRRATERATLPGVTTPSVTVLLPVLNEAATIDACLESLADQDYPGRVEIVIADGGSTDGTLDLVERWRDRLVIQVIDNPRRKQAHGLNMAAEAANGDILVRADGHTIYARDYLSRSVDALTSSNAVAVGGRLAPEGTTPFGRAVAAAMTSPLGIGPGRFHHSNTPEFVDTVYLGTFRRDDLVAIGGFRSFPSGAVEDADLFYRWRQLGRRVLLDPSIRSVYRPRQTPSSLARQFLRYGQGKAEMLHVNGRWPSWRPAAPTALLLGAIAFMIIGMLGVAWWPLLALLGAWLVAVAVAATPGAGSFAGWLRAAIAVAIMHWSYGIGLIGGLLRERYTHCRPNSGKNGRAAAIPDGGCDTSRPTAATAASRPARAQRTQPSRGSATGIG